MAQTDAGHAGESVPWRGQRFGKEWFGGSAVHMPLTSGIC